MLRQDGDQAIRAWFIAVAGTGSDELVFTSLALKRPAAPMRDPAALTLAGVVRGASSFDGITVELLSENGERRRQPLSADGRFSFPGVAPDVPVCLAASYLHRDHYSTRGRWLVPADGTGELVVDVTPRYVNRDQHPSDLKGSIYKHDNSVFADAYEPHRRVLWLGYGKVQEYEGLSFANNHGHLDCDRFFDNPDRCFRIVHLGSSHTVAMQVRLFEKTNFLLEAELGVRLGRPVEVISLGRNNGDLAANFPRRATWACTSTRTSFSWSTAATR